MDDDSKLATLIEKHLKTTRRLTRIRVYGILLITITLAAVYASPFVGDWVSKRNAHIAVVKVYGQIGKEVTDDVLNSLLGEAFDNKHAKGVILKINSPGGSAVQSGAIRKQLDALKADHPDKPVYAVSSDAMASGAYMIASGADYICGQPAALIGSIGVVMQTFIIGEALEKLGIEPQTFTAGDNKRRLNMFEKASPEDKAKFESMLKAIHDDFIALVKNGRGDKLTAPDKDIFNGDFWVGQQALELGLIDGICTIGGAADQIRESVGEDLPMRLYSEPFSLSDLNFGLNVSLATDSISVQ